MPICLFCPNELSTKTKPEHILLSALGGRKTTTRVICSSCNEKFGNTIDKALANQVAVLRNQLQLESGTGNFPPSLGRVQAGNETIKINGDGTLEWNGKPFTVTPLSDGTFDLQIMVRSPEELASLIPHIAAQLKTTEENVRKQIGATSGTWVSRRAGTVHFNMPLGGDDQCKSMLKSCLVLWATRVGNNELKSEPYKIAREYIAQIVDNQSTSPATPVTLHIDSRKLPHLDILTKRYGEFFNLVYVRSDASGRVIGHFTLYNILSWQFILAESGGAPDLRIALISNALNPGTWSDTIADEIDIDMGWLGNPEFDTSRPHERLSAAMTKSQKDGMERELSRIVTMVCQKYGYASDDAILDAVKLKSITNEISHRFAHLMMGIPYEEVVSGQTILTLG